MSLKLVLARFWLPAGLRNRKLAELARLTAEAFGEPAPRIDELRSGEALRAYAEFSRAAAERAQGRPASDLEALETRLFEAAESFGREIRRELRVSTRGDVMAAARLLYRVLEIDLEGDEDGGIVIRRCSFSSVYSPSVCRLMSRLDAGVLAGLAGGGGLKFSERLTEGASCCRARFAFPGGDRGR
jgi:hypothetical protein